jgi:hypothetical protein
LGISERRTLDQPTLQTVLQKYSQRSAEITEKKEQCKATADETLFPAKKSETCKWCPFQTVCPAFTENSAFSSPDLAEESIQQLIREYVDASATLTTLEEKKETMKIRFEECFASSDLQRFFGDTYQITRSLRDNRMIKDETALDEVLAKKNLLETSRSLNKTKIKKLKEQRKIPEILVQEKEYSVLQIKKS